MERDGAQGAPRRRICACDLKLRRREGEYRWHGDRAPRRLQAGPRHAARGYRALRAEAAFQGETILFSLRLCIYHASHDGVKLCWWPNWRSCIFSSPWLVLLLRERSKHANQVWALVDRRNSGRMMARLFRTSFLSISMASST